MSQSVRELTTRIARGDREAFADFYRAWFDVIYTESRGITKRDESFCLDVVHDVMLRVIRSLRPVDTERQLAAWLKTVVRTCAYDRFRAERRRRTREQRGAPSERIDPVDQALVERIEWLRREIDGLDAAHAGMLLLRYRFGWTLERIGSMLGMGPGAVDGRLSRAVARIRKEAGETFDES